MAGAFQPTINMMEGASLGLEDLTTRSQSDGLAALYDVRGTRRRRITATLPEMTEAETFGQFWKMQKQLGISGQLFFMWAGDDGTYKHDRSFLAVFEDLSPVEQARWPRFQCPFRLVEEIG